MPVLAPRCPWDRARAPAGDVADQGRDEFDDARRVGLERGEVGGEVARDAVGADLGRNRGHRLADQGFERRFHGDRERPVK